MSDEYDYLAPANAADSPQSQHRADTLAATVRDGLFLEELASDSPATVALSELVALAHAGAVWDMDERLVRRMAHWKERAERAGAETERLRGLLARALAAYDAVDEGTRIDAKMGYPLPGDSATSAALALHADETFADIRAALAGGQADKEPTT